MDTAMAKRTDKNISSKSRKKLIINNVLTVFNILLLIAAIVMAVIVLTGCSKEPERFPEAEAEVAAELDKIKSADMSDDSLKMFTESVSGDFDGSMLEGYVTKLKDFDYEILGSQKTEEENTVAVDVRITTYDFGNEYLRAWEEHMMQDEANRWENQFYSFLLLRLGSVSSKDYVSDAKVICTDPKGDGNWETDIKSNEELMNAVSGGMLNEIKNLAKEDVVMDESELYE